MALFPKTQRIKASLTTSWESITASVQSLTRNQNSQSIITKLTKPKLKIKKKYISTQSNCSETFPYKNINPEQAKPPITKHS